ncbi:glycosyltransferase involved in cell wall biosynthesis [Nitrosomonas nitrosa]|uniref:glycosyltransferase family 4 protein n=1 Tax=Nitrosomonas nitrosa TaxID=52442 RepID=UPI000D2F9024|nr:glycosyltransferase family 1 protein [Nitrosomonas nitrosa]PTQ90244.1 glycosyltransferase involved in cell wall biosynthesis [Nitrosomonas nitrosa]
MKLLQQGHHARILEHAFRIKGVTGPDSELKHSATAILKSKGVRALFDLLDQYVDVAEPSSESARQILTKKDKRNHSDKSSSNTQWITNCVIDISDIINYLLAGHKTVSGIQRLVIATLSSIPKPARASNVLISMHDYEKDGCRVIPWEFVDSVVRYISSGDDETKFISSVQTTITNSVHLDSASLGIESYTLLIMGAAWIVPGFPTAHRVIARKYKLHVVSILYDLIPYTYPDFVTPDAAREFVFYISSLLAISDGLISISKYVSDDLTNHRVSLGQNLIVYPLNYYAELAREIPFKAFQSSRVGLRSTMREKAIELGIETDNFVLNVGSVEIRKNHIGLFVAWRHLFAQIGGKCPQLVVVGRAGWKAESFFEALKSTNNLDGKLIVLHSIDDSFLSYLYETCKFTVYPSLEEGWGLPIGESLDAGKLCITSNRASMPEVGRELCRYVNPSEPLEIAKEITQLLANPELVKLAEQKIAASKPLKKWTEYQCDLSNLISAIRLERPHPVSKMMAANWFLASGQVVSFYWHLGSDTYDLPEGLSGIKRSLQGSLPSRLIVYTKLDRFESDGAWCKEPKIGLDFYIDIKQIKSRHLSVSLHYSLIFDKVNSLQETEITAKLTINFNDLIEDQPSIMAGKNYFEPTAVHFVTSDLVTFEFANIKFDDCKTNDDHQAMMLESILIPVKLEIEWKPGFNFVCSATGRKLDCLKIKELRVDY